MCVAEWFQGTRGRCRMNNEPGKEKQRNAGWASFNGSLRKAWCSGRQANKVTETGKQWTRKLENFSFSQSSAEKSWTNSGSKLTSGWIVMGWKHCVICDFKLCFSKFVKKHRFMTLSARNDGSCVCNSNRWKIICLRLIRKEWFSSKLDDCRSGVRNLEISVINFLMRAHERRRHRRVETPIEGETNDLITNLLGLPKWSVILFRLRLLNYRRNYADIPVIPVPVQTFAKQILLPFGY